MLRWSLAMVFVLFVSAVVVAGLAYGEEPQGPPPSERGPGGGGPPPGGQRLFGTGEMAMGPFRLLQIPKVKKELNLTDEQSEKIKQVAQEMRPGQGQWHGSGDARPSFEEMQKRMAERIEKIDKKLAEILKPDQLERFKQLRIQFQGPAAFANPEVAKTLQITDEQQKKLKEIITETGKQMRALGRPAEDATPAERKEHGEKAQKIMKEALGKCLEALTSKQREKFEKLRGKPFEFDFSAFGRQRGHRNQQPRERSDW
jgi:hypothetical protein